MAESSYPGSKLAAAIIVLLVAVILLSVFGLLPTAGEPSASHKSAPLPANIRKINTAGTPCVAWVVGVDDSEYLVVSHRSGLAVVKHKGK